VKPIRYSQHAIDQMRLRGASQSEVEDTIHSSVWQTTRQGRWLARNVFPFGQPSPVNQKQYAFKTVQAVFVDEPDAIVVITVLVLYGN
jgi:hypothetical protein